MRTNIYLPQFEIRGILLILLFFISYTGTSQVDDSIYPDYLGKTWKLVEKDLQWNLLNEARGDLNKDGIEDLAVILESKDSIPEKRCASCYVKNNKPRIILVLLNNNKGCNIVISQNNEFIARGDEGGMLNYLEPELTIEKGVLTIFYQFTRSNQSYSFEYENGKMNIIGAKSAGSQSASGIFEMEEYDFKKGKLISTTGHISNDEDEIEIIKFTIEPKNLGEFGKMYEWEIIENRSI